MSTATHNAATNANGNKHGRDFHPLSTQHFTQILRRPYGQRQQLERIWGIGFSLGGRTWLPLGKASMMVMSYHPAGNDGKGSIELRCVTARLDRETETIAYDVPRMSHDFGRAIFPGARERQLDPRDPSDNPQGAGNRIWVQLALHMDNVLASNAHRETGLSVLPTFPEFFAAFPHMDSVEMEITDSLKSVIADSANMTVEAVNALPEGQLHQMAASVWPDLWISPEQTDVNSTKKWLINTRFITCLSKASRIYEDFSNMVGVQTWNPIRDVKTILVPNPTTELAAANNVDLVAMFKRIDNPNEQVDATSEFANLELAQALLQECIKVMRQSIPEVYSNRLTDDHIVQLLRRPKANVTLAVTDPATQLTEEDAIAQARKVLSETRPHVSECVTDDDLRQVWRDPKQQLFASRMVRFQTLARDPRTPVESAFTFPKGMCAANVSANLWVGPDWLPENARGAHARTSAAAPPADVVIISE